MKRAFTALIATLVCFISASGQDIHDEHARQHDRQHFDQHFGVHFGTSDRGYGSGHGRDHDRRPDVHMDTDIIFHRYSGGRMILDVVQLKNGSEIIGNRAKFKVVKNKLAAPFKTCECDMFFGRGLSNVGSILDLAVQSGLITKLGSWFSYGDERIGQGRDKASDYLRANKELCDEIEAKLREIYNLKVGVKRVEEI